MKVYKNRSFARFARKEGISDAKLYEVIRNAENGRVDADYGGGVIKQRIARPNEGKSGGYRSIILLRHKTRAFFVYGFAKNDRDSIDEDEVRAFRELAKVVLQLNDEGIAKLLHNGTFEEVKCDG